MSKYSTIKDRVMIWDFTIPINNVSEYYYYKLFEEIIQDVIERGNLFYIGASQQLPIRFKEHDNEKDNIIGFHFSNYYENKEFISNIEKKLIQIYGNHDLNYNKYINGLGQYGGAQGLKEGKNMIYILEIKKQITQKELFEYLRTLVFID